MSNTPIFDAVAAEHPGLEFLPHQSPPPPWSTGKGRTETLERLAETLRRFFDDQDSDD